MSHVFDTVADMAHLIGYARVSTAEQEPALQRDALLAAGCARVCVDVASGSRDDRPQLARFSQRYVAGQVTLRGDLVR